MRKVRLSLIAVSLISISCSNNGNQYIRISSQESLEVPVTFAIIETGISIKGKNAATLDSVSHPKIIKALCIIKKYGVKELNTSNSSIAADYDDKENFLLAQSYKVKFNDLNKIDAFRSELLNVGFNEFNVVSYGSDSLQKYQKVLLKKAIESAKVKALALSENGGIKIGKICKIVDGNEPQDDAEDDFTPLANAKLFGKGGFAEGIEKELKAVEPTIVKKTFTIKATFTVYFAI